MNSPQPYPRFPAAERTEALSDPIPPAAPPIPEIERACEHPHGPQSFCTQRLLELENLARACGVGRVQWCWTLIAAGTALARVDGDSRRIVALQLARTAMQLDPDAINTVRADW